MNKDHDYSVFLAIIVIWMMVSALAQCESASRLGDIKRELIMLRYKQNIKIMTNREIKFELAKIALERCTFTTSEALTSGLKNLYEWVVEEPEVDVDKPKTDYDKISVREIIKYLVKKGKYSDQRYTSSLVDVFNDNGINTIGDILRMGRREFIQLKGVGKGSVTRIDDTLEELYGIVNWSSNETY